MSLRASIDRDYLESVKAKDAFRVGVLRMLKNNLKNTAIAKRLPEDQLMEEDMIAVVRQEVKKRKESIAAFTAGNRADLADQEKLELTVLEKYLPASMDAATINQIIQEVMSENNLQPPHNFGKVMGMVVKKVAGRADGDTVKKAVTAFLAAS